MNATDSMFEPVKRVRASETIVAQLEQRILRGDLVAGSRLPAERALMQEFEVSRPTIREALRVAESMGLIEVRHSNQGGPVVTAEPFRSVSRAFEALLASDTGSPADLVELRMVVEGTAALLAAGRPARELEPVRKAFQAMDEAVDDDAFITADVEFHARTAEVSTNPALILVITALRQPILDSVKLPLRDLGSSAGRALTLKRHEKLLEAMLAGDGKLARAWSHRGLYDSFAPGMKPAERKRLEAILSTDGADKLSPTMVPDGA